MIREHDGRIYWSDFRDFTGVYIRPLVDVEPAGGSALRLPDLVFEEIPYRAEVARATKDRSWETEARQSARLLRERLVAYPQGLAERGYEVRWVAPANDNSDTFSVSLFDSEGRQTVVRLSPPQGAPETRAVAMASTLSSDAPERWDVTFRWGRHH